MLNEIKKEMKSFPTHTEKALKQHSALATASLPKKVLSREWALMIKLL